MLESYSAGLASTRSIYKDTCKSLTSRSSLSRNYHSPNRRPWPASAAYALRNSLQQQIDHDLEAGCGPRRQPMLVSAIQPMNKQPSPSATAVRLSLATALAHDTAGVRYEAVLVGRDRSWEVHVHRPPSLKGTKGGRPSVSSVARRTETRHTIQITAISTSP